MGRAHCVHVHSRSHVVVYSNGTKLLPVCLGVVVHSHGAKHAVLGCAGA